jgi:hypothetical protein
MRFKLTDEQARSRWQNAVSKIERFTITEQANALMDIAYGRSIKEIAAICDKGHDWVRERLAHSGINAACEKNGISTAAEISTNISPDSKSQTTRPAIKKVLAEYGPDMEDKDFKKEVKSLVDDGYQKDVATALAKAEWAGEVAIQEKVIKQSAKDREKQTRQFLFPNSQEDKMQNTLAMHILRVKAAAKFLDECNMKLLRKKKNAAMILEAGEMFAAEVERINAVFSS